MSDDQADDAFALLIEDLAALEHERWAHWQKYMHSKGIRQPDGSVVLPADLVEQWERQISTAYDHLTEREKESDREQVRRYLPLLKRWATDLHRSKSDRHA